MNQPTITERLLTYQDVAAILHVHVKTVARQWRHRRKFRPTHNTVRIFESDFEAYLAENCRRG